MRAVMTLAISMRGTTDRITRVRRQSSVSMTTRYSSIVTMPALAVSTWPCMACWTAVTSAVKWETVSPVRWLSKKRME